MYSDDEDITWLVCPLCKNSIPSLSHLIQNQKAYVEIKCSCNNMKPQIMSIEEYLEKMTSIANSLDIYSLIFLTCKTHREEYNSYCYSCKKRLCNGCMSDHLRHNTINIGVVVNSLDTDKLTENFEKSKNNSVINNQLSKDYIISMLMQKQEEIKEAIEQIEKNFEINKKINDDLINFCECLFQNFHKSQNARKITNINILNNFLDNTKFNLLQCEINENKLLESSKNLCEYYKNYYIIRKKEDSYIKTKSIETKRTIHCIKLLSNNNIAVGTSPDEEENNIIIYSLPNLETIKKISGHFGSVSTINEIEINSNIYLLTGADDKSIKIWNEKNYECELTIREHEQKITKIVTLKDTCTIASSSWDRIIKIIDLYELNDKKYKVIGTLIGHKKDIKSIIQLKDGNLLSCSADKKMKIWDIKEEECINEFENVFSSTNNSILELNDGRIAVGGGKSVKIYNLSTMQEEDILHGHELWVNVIKQIKPELIITGSSDQTIKIWDLNFNDCVGTIKNFESSISDICLVNNNGDMVTGTYKGFLTLWKHE